MTETMIDALRLIAGRSPSVAREAIKALRAPDTSRQLRYNAVADIAISDPEADYTSDERALIARFVEPIETEARSRQLPPIRVSEAEYADIAERASDAGQSLSGYMRARLLSVRDEQVTDRNLMRKAVETE